MVSAKNIYINCYAWATGNPSKNTRYFILLCFYDTHNMFTLYPQSDNKQQLLTGK